MTIVLDEMTVLQISYWDIASEWGRDMNQCVDGFGVRIE